MLKDNLLMIEKAAQKLRDGAVIAYPTEAVYGLGCDPGNEASVRRILRLKSRPVEAGLILIADRFERFAPYVAKVPDRWLQRAMAVWPGPVTWLFPRGPGTPDWLAGDHPTIALRVTAHAVAGELCARFGGALVSTSANPRSQAPARTPAEVEAYFGNAIEGIVEGSLGTSGKPSEIRDLASGRIARKG
ncbi:MAG: Sua5/YciO/YrdC/YwlC family protein [Xanthomonadales bacterium]|nr:Sua5/YciO/YrdC/YwlC family protein [Xanthomonadales bacterium]